jgi:thiamine-phosphate pyrophosphorylase
MKKTPFERDLYVVSGEVTPLKNAIDEGAAIVQLRDKSEDRAGIVDKAREMVAYKEKKRFLFILNDDPRLAVEVGADGVHIGQDMSTKDARKVVGEGMIVGKTTHNLEQARQAIADGVDYISAGPVYPTPTKPGRPAVGLSYVKEVAENLGIPFVAIGGIDLSNIDDVLAAGAKTVAVVRAWRDAAELLGRIRNRG